MVLIASHESLMNFHINRCYEQMLSKLSSTTISVDTILAVALSYSVLYKLHKAEGSNSSLKFLNNFHIMLSNLPSTKISVESPHFLQLFYNVVYKFCKSENSKSWQNFFMNCYIKLQNNSNSEILSTLTSTKITVELPYLLPLFLT